MPQAQLQPAPFRVPMLDTQGQLVESWRRFFLSSQNLTNQLLLTVQSLGGSKPSTLMSDEGDQGDNWLIPGPAGIQGVPGVPGPPAVAVGLEEGDSGVEWFTGFPPPADSVLSPNVALLNRDHQIFTGVNNFTSVKMTGNLEVDGTFAIQTVPIAQAGITSNAALVGAGGAALQLRMLGTLTAGANNDSLYGIYINPTYATGGFTGVSGYGLRILDVPATLSSTYAIYTGLGQVHLGGNIDIVAPTNAQIAMTATSGFCDLLMVPSGTNTCYIEWGRAAGSNTLTFYSDKTGAGVAATVSAVGGWNIGSGVTDPGAKNLNVEGTITSVGNAFAPTQAATDNSTKVATTAYVTTGIANAIAAVNPAVSVTSATTVILPFAPAYLNGVTGIGATLIATSFGVLTIDGYTPLLNDRILVKNQASSFQNGVYTVSVLGTAGVFYTLTRALDFDQPSDMNNTGAIPVVNGTVNGTTTWLLTSTIVTVGTDAVTFTKFSFNPANVVTSIIGTANQIAASSATGDVTLSLAGPHNVTSLTANAIVLGNGSSALGVLASLGTTTTLLHGNAAGAPTFSAVSLTADVTGTLPAGNGGTGVTTTVLPGTSTITTTGTSTALALPAGSGNLIIFANNATILTIQGITAGTDGQRLTIYSIGAGQVDLAHQNVGATAANRLINIATSGNTSLAAGSGFATYIYDLTATRWRLDAHEQGAWITPAFAAGNFTGSGAMTWTVIAGNVGTFKYRLSGRMLTVVFYVHSTSVGGTPGTALQILIPGGFTSANLLSAPVGAAYDNGGNGTVGLMRVNVNATLLFNYKDLSATANWTAAAGTTEVDGTISFEVN